MTDKLQNPSTAPTTYWAILSCLLYYKTIAAIPPLLVDGKFISDFCEKANPFEKANLFKMNRHNHKPTDIISKQDVTVYLTYIKILKD